MAGAVTNRRSPICIANDVVKANNTDLLKEFGGNLELTGKWARRFLEKLEMTQHKGTTGRTISFFLVEEKFTFQKEISNVVSNHDIPPCLVVNIDHCRT